MIQHMEDKIQVQLSNGMENKKNTVYKLNHEKRQAFITLSTPCLEPLQKVCTIFS